MLSKSGAKYFFVIGTVLSMGVFLALTFDTFQRIPQQTHADKLTESVIRGKHLWEKNNCMGCHTIFGEGAYYAPELTKVFERRGENFISSILRDPQSMYPGERKMQNYRFNDAEISDLVEFFKWIGEVDLNGFPKKPDLIQTAVIPKDSAESPIAKIENRPSIFNQVCIACHSLGGQGGKVGPALDDVAVRLSVDYINRWIRDPQSIKADAKMPKLPLSELNIIELTAFLSSLKPGVVR